jgi:hypothetical protein
MSSGISPTDASSATSFCGHCQNTRALERKLYCSSDYVMQAVVTSRKPVGSDWVKFAIHIVTTYKYPTTSHHYQQQQIRGVRSSSGRQPSRRRVKETAWVHVGDLSCGCPKLAVQKTYLLAGMLDDAGSVAGEDSLGGGGGGGKKGGGNIVVLGRDSVVMLWRADWASKLKRYARIEQRGKC